MVSQKTEATMFDCSHVKMPGLICMFLAHYNAVLF